MQILSLIASTNLDKKEMEKDVYKSTCKLDKNIFKKAKHFVS